MSRCYQHFTSDGQPNVEQTYPDPNDLDAERGRCAGSRDHIVNLTAVVETPQFANQTLRAVAGGWRVSGIYRWATGTYLDVTSGQDRALSDISNISVRTRYLTTCTATAPAGRSCST